MSEAPAYQRFFAELKRRKVFRVMAVYGGVAFVILQVADIALPGLGLPEWTLTLILLLTLLGFPLAIVLAWAFEMTPDGVKKTAEAGPGEIAQIVEAPAGSRWPVGLAAAGGTALFLVGAWLMFGRPAPGASGNADGPTVDPDAPVESIAVLPFADLSPAGDQEYFGDGLAEELLDALANVDGLVVAARTSSFRFKGDDVDIPEVAEKLGVQTVLEGSVRSGGDRVRITAQLVNAAGFHLWSDSYDRTIAQMQDLITVQEEIAQAIVAALSLAPEGNETGGEPMETLVAQGTDNLEAYNAVLRGRHLAAQRTPRSLELAAEQFERAVALDPGYAKAWADLGMTNSLRRGWGFDLDSVVEARGAEATERALELDPDMAEAHTALGYIYAFIQRDSAAADQAFARAIELDPRYPTAYHWRGEILGDSGHPDSGIPYLERARELDPLSPIILVDLATALDQAGRWDEAEALYEEVLELEPDFAPAFSGMVLHARLAGDAEAALSHSLRFLDLTPGADAERTGFWAGNASFMAGDLTKAVEEFRLAVPTDTSEIREFTRGAVPSFLFALERVEGTDAAEAFIAGQLSRTDAADSLYAIWLEGYGRVVAGDDAGGRTAVRRLEAVEEHPNWMSWSLLEAIGDPDPWFAKAEAEFESNEFKPTAEDRFWLEHDPSLAPMRADPRFKELLDRLPPYPGPAGRN